MIMKKAFYRTVVLSLLVTSSAQSALHNDIFEAIRDKTQQVVSFAKEHPVKTALFGAAIVGGSFAAYSYVQSATLLTKPDNTNIPTPPHQPETQTTVETTKIQSSAFDPKTQSSYHDLLKQLFTPQSHISDAPATTSGQTSSAASDVDLTQHTNATDTFATHNTTLTQTDALTANSTANNLNEVKGGLFEFLINWKTGVSTRLNYCQEVEETLHPLFAQAMSDGVVTREEALEIFNQRNALKYKYRAQTSEEMMEQIHARNQGKYSSQEGPSFEELVTKYKSNYERLAQKAINGGGGDLFGISCPGLLTTFRGTWGEALWSTGEALWSILEK